jgi:hypothetical protein
MKLQERIEILVKLGEYLNESLSPEDTAQWQRTIHQASVRNAWFTNEHIRCATQAISNRFLKKEMLTDWAKLYDIANNPTPRKIGIVMAGNIPMVGFHDLLCVFISGHRAICKLSSKDDVLLKHLISVMNQWNSVVNEYIVVTERLNDCDAYIATGSNNSARYFEYYFGKYPSIIRKNRTSVAILNGQESKEELDALADDIMLYFGLGCRNVTQIAVPQGYDFIPLLDALKKYRHFFDHPKYKNNYDYQLTIYIMNNLFYMTNDSIVLIENEQPFSPIGTLHYRYYDQEEAMYQSLQNHPDIQAIVGRNGIALGKAQTPSLTDYADGVDVMTFLKNL